MLRVGVLANWGMGLAVVKTLAAMPHVSIVLAGTRCISPPDGPWSHCVAHWLHQKGIEYFDDKEITPPRLEAMILERKTQLLVTHAHMRRLPESVLRAPELGVMNIHASLLPRYRGPSPCQWVLRNRDKETGLTAYMMDAGLDTGPIVHQQCLPLQGNEDMDVLLERLKPLVEPLLHTALQLLCTKGFVPCPQDEALACHAPRILTDATY